MKRPSFYWLLGLGLWLSAAAWAQQDGDAAAQKADETPAKAESSPGNEKEENEPGRRHIGDVIRFANDAVIKEGEDAGDVVVIFGDATVDGRAEHVVVVFGTAKVNGTIRGNFVVPLGSAELGPNAHIEGDAVIVGGDLHADPSARIDHSPVEVSWSRLEERAPVLAGVKNWVVQGPILGRPLPHRFGWWWIAALACAGVYLLTAVMFARPVAASVEALESQPVGSFFVGVLMFILFLLLQLLLVATGIGIIVVPFAFCAAFVAFLFGKVAVYRFVGQQIGKQLGVAALQLPLVALLIGIVVFYFLYIIPILGLLAWVMIAPLGFGAATLALFRAFRSEGGNRGNSRTSSAVVSTPPTASPTPPVIPGEAAALASADVTILPRAGFWLRFAATFLDFLLVGAASAVTHFPPFFPFAWVAYHVGMWTWKGTTIGGIVFGMKIFRRDGRQLDFAVALVRSLASFFSALVMFLGFFWAGWNREKLSWHDMIAGTIVVKMPKGISLF